MKTLLQSLAIFAQMYIDLFTYSVCLEVALCATQPLSYGYRPHKEVRLHAAESYI